jgi:transcriptional regulator with XRE-family HTH domain
MTSIEQLVDRMGQLGVTQEELAAQLKVDQSTVSRWLSGRRAFPQSRISQIESVLDSAETFSQGLPHLEIDDIADEEIEEYGPGWLWSQVSSGWDRQDRWDVVAAGARRQMDALGADVSDVARRSGVALDTVARVTNGQMGTYSEDDLLSISRALWGHRLALGWLIGGTSILDVETGLEVRRRRALSRRRADARRAEHREALGPERVAQIEAEIAWATDRVKDLEALTHDDPVDEEDLALLEHWRARLWSAQRQLEPPLDRKLLFDRFKRPTNDHYEIRREVTDLLADVNLQTLRQIALASAWLAARSRHERTGAKPTIALEDFVEVDARLPDDLVEIGNAVFTGSHDVEDHAMAAASGADPTGIPDTPIVSRPSPEIEPDPYA